MPATDDTRAAARYDGIADAYDAQIWDATHRRQILRDHLWRGSGRCIDIGCGTGRDLPVIAEFGWTPVGLDLSADQLRLAHRWSRALVQGDAERLPFASDTFALALSSWTSTDVDHFDVMLTEVARVLRPDGRFLFHGAHPCFNGPHVENRADGSRTAHPGYRQARRHSSAPWWGKDGIRSTTGMRHVPLAEFINAFTHAGLRLEHVSEPGTEPIPHAVVVLATKPTR